MPDPIVPLPDDELALIQYLRGRTQVTDLVPAERITTALPPSPTYPYVLVQRIGGNTTERPLWLDSPTLQVDVLGPPDRAACKRLTQVVRASVIAIANDTVPAGVLASAAEEVPPQWLPDTLSNPPLPRFTARYRVVLHP